jgi:hypothetical protein
MVARSGALMEETSPQSARPGFAGLRSPGASASRANFVGTNLTGLGQAGRFAYRNGDTLAVASRLS